MNEQRPKYQVSQEVALFEQFEKDHHRLVLNDVNNSYSVKASLGSYKFSWYFCQWKASKIGIFRKSYIREDLEKLESLALEIYSVSYIFYITKVKI